MTRGLATAAWRGVFGALSPSGRRARLSILIYHRVLPDPDPMRPGEPDAERFAWQMEWIGSLFRVLPLGEAVERQRNDTLPARAACITFDDGYADNHGVALPILQRLGLPATFFIATGFLDGGRMFNDTVIELLRRAPEGDLDLTAEGLGRHRIVSTRDRLAAVNALLRPLKYATLEEREQWLDRLGERLPYELPDDLMMRAGQVTDLVRQGMEVGAHTVNHPILSRESEARARAEIVKSRDDLTRMTGTPIRLFAYPNGRLGDDFTVVHRAIVSDCDFDAAVTTHAGVANSQTNPYLLPRFTPWDRTRQRFALRLARNLAS
ncbi:MAG: polysaccharide deacetylase family protein [Halofilum sp. (in: g-proteobacteria)]